MTNDKATILFVDDEPHILSALNWLFRKQYNVLLADCGGDALRMLKEHKVDVLVSDQRMPGMTGIEVLRGACEASPDTLRILLTGYSDLHAVIGSVNQGEVFRFIQKPWSNSKIRETLVEAVEIARQTRSENAAASATPKPTTDASQPGVMVLDQDPAIYQGVLESVNGRCPVHLAQQVDQALELLEKQKIGVMIAETRLGQTDVTALVKLLKQFHPEIVTIMVTNHSDVELVIDLINEGQIFRFLPKPLRSGICKISIDSALRKHQKLVDNPVLKIRHIVDKTAFLRRLGIDEKKLAKLAEGGEVAGEDLGFFGQLFSRVRGLRLGWAS